jgi:hypothetical protein
VKLCKTPIRLLATGVPDLDEVLGEAARRVLVQADRYTDLRFGPYGTAFLTDAIIVQRYVETGSRQPIGQHGAQWLSTECLNAQTTMHAQPTTVVQAEWFVMCGSRTCFSI